MKNIGFNAKVAARGLAGMGTELKNMALLKIAEALTFNSDKIIAANALDLKNGEESGLPVHMLERLMLNSARIEGMASGVRQVAALDDPVGHIDEGVVRPNGLLVQKTRVPLGVIGIIYESRPNVTSDAAALCLKAGNAVILRGGKEAINSNIAISDIMRDALADIGLNPDCIQLIKDTSRASAAELMSLDALDVLIPRGGASLIQAVKRGATVPVIETGVGNCHIYVDESADISNAAAIVHNAKTSRPSVCNAAETLLIHAGIAEKALPVIADALSGVELRGCEEARRILGDSVVSATEADFETEFLDLILAVRVVKNIQEALDHIAKYSSGHSEAIITNDYSNSTLFTREVDSAAVYVNASTRFTDGGEFGLGAEIGISTQKLHARGPMGLNQLTTIKYIILGQGQVR